MLYKRRSLTTATYFLNMIIHHGPSVREDNREDIIVKHNLVINM